MLTPSKSSHQKHVEVIYNVRDLPPFSLPKSLWEEWGFMTATNGLAQLEGSRAGFVGKNIAYLVMKKVF